MKSINLFGIKVLNITMEQALEQIGKSVEQKQQSRCYFVNADCFNKVWSDENYFKILSSTPYIWGDGSGVKLGAKIVSQNIIDNVNGTDMLPLLCKQALAKDHSLFLLGSKPGIAEKMSENLKTSYSGIRIAGYRDGYFDWDTESETVVGQINASQADILLVAFGAPRQEMWIQRYSSQLDAKALIGVGGLFDFFSGTMPRAPLWMRKLGVEWIFRLYKEPKRMWKRYIIGNPLFVFRLKKWKRSGKLGFKVRT